MSTRDDFGEAMTEWARSVPSVNALVLIGSRERCTTDEVWRADLHSDWDFQIITSEPKLFLNSVWTKQLHGLQVHAYATRIARIGGVPKVNVVFGGVEADFVVVPATWLRNLMKMAEEGLHRREGKVRRALQDLAIVIRPGWKFLKGNDAWDPFYRKVVAEVPDARLSDDGARQLAQVFACEQVWIRRKIARGEFIAAHRVLHRELAETNFRLLHELKLRRGERSFPEARRIERVASESELAEVCVNAAPDSNELSAAVELSARTCERLMRALVGESWRRLV